MKTKSWAARPEPPEQKVGGSNPLGRTIKINYLRPFPQRNLGLTSENGWVREWAVSAMRTCKLLNSWRAHKCLEPLIFCWPGKRSMFESAVFHAVSINLPLIFPSNFSRNFGDFGRCGRTF